MHGRDPGREATAALDVLERELTTAFPGRTSFTAADVAGLSDAAKQALAQLEALVWPSGTVDEAALVGLFESAATDLWRADGSNVLTRAGRFATVDALY